MTYEQIDGIIQKKKPGQVYEIRFKTREPIKGLFIKAPDYVELSRKNFWRVVIERHIEEYKKTTNEGLAKIFNGKEFTKLEAGS